MKRIEQITHLGAFRTKSGFLLFPKTIYMEDIKDTRWLERATWMEKSVSLGLLESNGWHPVKWLEDED